MAYKNKKFLLLGVLAISSILATDEFVVKKTKKVSTNDLKTECCTILKETVELFSDTMHLLADEQELAFKKLSNMVETECEGMDRVALEKLQNDLKEFEKRQEAITDLMRKQVAFLRK